MSRYSVAEAKNGLPGLIDKAMAGDEVIITRHGKPVAELRAMPPELEHLPRDNGMASLRRWRETQPAVDITSVELLRQLYEDDD